MAMISFTVFETLPISIRVLRPLNIKDQLTHKHSHVALITQLREPGTGKTEVVGSNPVQSLKIFSVHFSSSGMAAFASFIMSAFH